MKKQTCKKNKVNIEGFLEFLNDAMFTSIFLEINKNLKNEHSKNYISYFLVNISSIYMYDIMQSSFVDKNKLDSKFKKEIKLIRNDILKPKYFEGTNHYKTKTEEMGISFDEYVYDCVITINKCNDLYDVNFRSWKKGRTIEDRIFYYDLVKGCSNFVETLLIFNEENQYNVLMEVLGEFIKEYATIIDKEELHLSSYSTHKLFINSKINNNDKAIILQYYGCLKSLLFFEKIIEEAPIKITIGNINFSSSKFFVKIKAVFIEALFDAWLKENSIIWKKIETFINEEIPNEFWEKNRDIRRNIHYDDYNKISEEDYKYVDKYQEIYISKVLNVWEQELNLKIGFLEKTYTKIGYLISYFKSK